jgi:hypothetical protein
MFQLQMQIIRNWNINFSAPRRYKARLCHGICGIFVIAANCRRPERPNLNDTVFDPCPGSRQGNRQRWKLVEFGDLGKRCKKRGDAKASTPFLSSQVEGIG